MERLRNVQFFDTAALPNASFDFRDGQLRPASAPNAAIGRLPVLQQLTGLKSLVVQPQHVIHADGWQDIGRLTQLESLWVQNTSVQSANESENARSAATTALSQLTKLRQLNVANASLAALPPMPNLEYVVLDAGLTLDQNLRTLAQHSPKLREIALRPYAEFELTSSMRDSLRRMPALRTIWLWSGMTSETDRLTPQIAVMRAQLPGISIRAGEYTRFRSMALFIFGVTMFWPFLIVAVHRQMMQTVPQAGYIPEYHGPHLFWPCVASGGMIILFVIVGHFFNVAWYAALALILSGIFPTAAPNDEVNRTVRMILGWTSMALTITTLSILAALKFAPLFAEEFLAGEWRGLSAGMIITAIALIPSRTSGSTRAFRVWAEVGSSTITGMVHGAEQFSSVSSQTNGVVGHVIRLQENITTRRLFRCRSKDFTSRLQAITTGTVGRFIVFGLIFAMILLFRQLVLTGPISEWSAFIAVALFQGSIMSLILTAATWRGRRHSLALDLLRPVSRHQFWRSVQTAILREMLPTILITITGAFLLIWLTAGNKAVPWPVIVPVVVLNGCGVLAMCHAMTIWVCVSPRLWFAVTLSTIGSCLVVIAAIPTVPMILNDVSSISISLLISLVVAMSGLIAQFLVRRSLPHRELGLITK